jgi:hypothetical protein
MRHPRIPRPSRAMAVALLAVGLNLTGVAYAATGGNFLLGKANTAAGQTALTETTPSVAGLKVTNTAAKPAASFNAPAGVAPIAVNSQTKVTNLNADLLDGFDSASFPRASDTSIVVALGGETSVDIGPYSVLLDCSGTTNNVTFTQQLLDNAPNAVSWFDDETLSNGFDTGGQTNIRQGSAGSGETSELAEQHAPSTGSLSQPDDVVHFVWRGGSGSGRGTYLAYVLSSICVFTGTWDQIR